MRAMTQAEYRKALDRLDLSQHAAADLLGLARRTGQNYAGGHTAVPGPVAILIRLALASRVSLAAIERARDGAG